MTLTIKAGMSRTKIKTRPPVPNAPSGLIALPASSSQINLSWTDNSANEAGFHIQRSPDGSTWSDLVSVGAGVTAYSDTGLTSNTVYYYRVSAYNGAGNSGWTNTASARTSGGVTGRFFYIAPNAGTGTGTISNPYGLGDLQGSTNQGTWTAWFAGSALTNLQPGDTLYFRGGIYPIFGADYNASGGYGGFQLGLSRSGTASQPITLRNYPGEAVTISQQSFTGQIIFGGTLDYIRYLGLTVNQCAGDTSGLGTSKSWFLTDSNHNEIAYCKVTGCNAPNVGSNWSMIELGTSLSSIPPASGNWIHHNEFFNLVGQSTSPNNAAINDFCSGAAIVEDNYFHHVSQAVYIKASAFNNWPDGTQQITYRRNWSTDPPYGWPDFRGPGEDGAVGQSQLIIYDNVFTRGLVLQWEQSGTQVYNNIFVSSSISPGGFGPSWVAYDDWNDDLLGDKKAVLTQFWNNICVPGTGSAIWLTQIDDDYGDFTSPSAPCSYCNFQVYVGTPGFYGNISHSPTTRTLAQFQGLDASRAENNCHVVAALTDVYNDLTSWVLKTSYQTAGVASPTDATPVCVGPGRSTPSVNPAGVITVAQIMDITRYGPSAIGSYA